MPSNALKSVGFASSLSRNAVKVAAKAVDGDLAGQIARGMEEVVAGSDAAGDAPADGGASA